MVLTKVKGEGKVRAFYPECQIQKTQTYTSVAKLFFAGRGYSLPIEYYDSIKGKLSDSYTVIGQV